MPTYELRLEATDSPQYRRVTLDAPDESTAREEALRLEHRAVEFSLLPPDKATWECPPGSTPDDPDGLANQRRWDAHTGAWGKWAAGQSYSTAVKAAEERLRRTAEGVAVKDAKLVGLAIPKTQAVRYMQHLQAEPYSIVDVRAVSQDEIAAGVEALAGAIRMRDIARRYQANPPKGIDPATWIAVEEALRQGGVPMNVVTAVLYGLPWEKQINGSSVTVFSTAAIKMSLHTAYTLDQNAHDFFNDVSGTQIANGNGYTTGGYTFANKASTYDTGTQQIRLDNTVDPNWTASTLSATDAIIANTTPGTDATNPIYGAIDFGATVTTSAGTLTVALDTAGWAAVDVT